MRALGWPTNLQGNCRRARHCILDCQIVSTWSATCHMLSCSAALSTDVSMRGVSRSPPSRRSRCRSSTCAATPLTTQHVGPSSQAAFACARARESECAGSYAHRHARMAAVSTLEPSRDALCKARCHELETGFTMTLNPSLWGKRRAPAARAGCARRWPPPACTICCPGPRQSPGAPWAGRPWRGPPHARRAPPSARPPAPGGLAGSARAPGRHRPCEWCGPRSVRRARPRWSACAQTAAARCATGRGAPAPSSAQHTRIEVKT